MVDCDFTSEDGDQILSLPLNEDEFIKFIDDMITFVED